MAKNKVKTQARQLTQRMARTELRPLLVLARQLVADAVEQLHVALLLVLPQRGDECPG